MELVTIWLSNISELIVGSDWYNAMFCEERKLVYNNFNLSIGDTVKTLIFRKNIFMINRSRVQV